MGIRLNHIGIAVLQEEKLKKLFELLGLSVSRVESVPSEKVKTTFIPAADHGGGAKVSDLELLEPTDQESTVAKFLQKKGKGGVHHLSFEVGQGELESLCQKLSDAGVQLIYDQPQPGAHQMKVNFIHPKSADGVLIEIMEKVES